MPYFSENYGAVRYPIGTDTVAGLRKAQIGALHAISSHFTIRTDSALVSLPTGAGKTLVLTLCHIFSAHIAYSWLRQAGWFGIKSPKKSPL